MDMEDQTINPHDVCEQPQFVRTVQTGVVHTFTGGFLFVNSFQMDIVSLSLSQLCFL